LFVDFHSHILPGIDDGSQDVKTSCEMLKILKKQGVGIVAATPHFYAHKQSLEDFLEIRQHALNKLTAAFSEDMPVIVPAAEVYIQRGIHNLDLSALCYGKTNFILIEFPYTAYQSWMLEEVYNLSISQSFTPVFAHLDRYLTMYNLDAVKEILDFDHAIIQVNHSSLFERTSRKMVFNWIKEGLPVVFGSDCHNTQTRVPQNDRATSIIQSKLGKRWLEGYDKFSADLIGYPELKI
jgi:protein-tyrosine phosphatase